MDETQRSGFIFYNSFYAAISELDDDTRLKVYDAVMRYALLGEESALSGVPSALFKLIKPQLDANNIKYQNGCKGGRPKTKIKPKDNQTVTESERKEERRKKKEERVKNISIPNKRAFSPPTIEEIKAYCQERKNKVDAEVFRDFYSSKGWMVGKNKMKDWKACIRTWEKNKRGSPEKQDYQQRNYDAEHFEKDRQESIDEIQKWYDEQPKDENGDVITEVEE